MEFEAGDINLQRYAGNDPVNIVDGSGLDGWWDTVSSGLQIVGGGLEIVGGVAMATATAPTGVGLVGGVAIAAHGTDTFFAGVRGLWYGKSQRTYFAQGVTAAASATPMSPQAAQLTGDIADAIPGLFVGKVPNVPMGSVPALSVNAFGTINATARPLVISSNVISNGSKLGSLNSAMNAGSSLGQFQFARTMGDESSGGSAQSASGAPSSGRSTNFPELKILNPNFTPDAKLVLQNVTNQVNSGFGANLKLATTVLSDNEMEAAARSYGLAFKQYGNAVERLVAIEIEADPMLDSLYTHIGGANKPDFIGKGIFGGMNFDITTPRQIDAHLARPNYGPGLKIITYDRPPNFP